MSDYNNGQIWGWNGGECPVRPETVVNTWHRNELYSRAEAGEYWWDHRDSDADIIAFQVAKAYVEPKVIWVNEYAGGNYGYAYKNKEEALLHDAATMTRIAVKYVEVVDDKEMKDD